MQSRLTSINLYEKIVHGMLICIAVCAIVYCLVLLSIVFSVIERKQNTLATRDANSTLSTLEAQYANTVASIDDAVLSQNNYVRIHGATFAVRKDAIASYSVLYAR